MSISIVIPNFNNEKLLQKNLPYLHDLLVKYKKKNGVQAEIIVNDDGSTDKSREYLSEQVEKLKESEVNLTSLSNGRNFGFSTTVNRGVAKAQGDIVILLNTDVTPDEGFLDPLLEHFKDPQVFAVGCMDKSIEADGSIVLRGRGIGRWEKGFMLHSRGEPDTDNTLWVSGGSGAFRRSLWEKLGGLNEMMNRFYWEDIDLSYRALKAGYKLIFEKRSTVVHNHEEGSIKKTTKPMSVRITSYRNQFYFVWVNISDTPLLLSHLLWLPIHLLYAGLHGDTAFLKGWLQAIIHLPGVIRRRHLVQRFFKISDKAVLSAVVK